MRLVEQIEELIELLEEAKDDLKEWVEAFEDVSEPEAIEETNDLIGKIESTLHEIGY